MDEKELNNEIIPKDLQAKVDAWFKDREHLSDEQQIELANDIISELYKRCMDLKFETLVAQISEITTERAYNKLRNGNKK